MSQSFAPAALDLLQGHFMGGRLVSARAGIDLPHALGCKAFASGPITDAAKAAMKPSGWGQCQPNHRLAAGVFPANRRTRSVLIDL
jgi:aldehyde dehydrogenase (NAD+)